MIVTANRLRSVGWIALLALCAALVMVLAFRVNSLRSQVHRAELRIVSLRQEKMYLETEFETRANQQQLKAWNDVEFGYVAPTASQYLENERQLAAWSKPSELDAPAPIRVASADDSVIAQAAFPAMVSPLSGKPVADERPDAGTDGAQPDPAPKPLDHAAATATLGDRLAKVGHAEKPAKPAVMKPKATSAKADKPAAAKEKSTAKAGSKPTKATSTGSKLAANDTKRKEQKGK